ncbi:MAG: ABC transporter ATP-binding protein [Desulfovibrio sp.]
MTKLLSIENLTTGFATTQGVAAAVDNVTLHVHSGETLAIVGESGCGKTVLALSLLGLVPDPPGKITAGQVHYNGQDLTKLSEPEMQSIRGNEISMIFQEPMTSLNPVFTIGDQITEAIARHTSGSKEDYLNRAVEMLGKVGIPSPETRMKSYPHELSGGMRQRVMIAMALSCNPAVLIADEPTTALDVTIQAQILHLISSLKESHGTAVLLITHDLGVVARNADRVAVMYSGVVIEEATTKTLFKAPMHPYTKGLMQSIPKMGARRKLSPVPGSVPNIFNRPRGCRFNPRCEYAMARCGGGEPPLFKMKDNDGNDRQVRCWLYE